MSKGIDPEEYINLSIKDRVREQTDTYLEKKRSQFMSLAKIAGPLLTIIIGLLGLQNCLTINELKNQQREARSLADTLNKDVAQAIASKDSAVQSVGQAQNMVDKANGLVSATTELTASNNKSVLESQGKLLDMQKELYKQITSTSNLATQVALKADQVNRASTISEDAANKAQEALNKANSAKTNAEQASGVIDVARGKIAKTETETQETLKKVNTSRDEILQAGTEIKNLKELNKQLMILQASETFVLKGGQHTDVIVHYPDQAGKPVRYKFNFFVNNIQTYSTVQWEVELPDGSKKKGQIVIEEAHKGEDVKKQIMDLYPPPFVLEVDYINYAKLAPDFIILRLTTRERNIGEPSPSQ